MAAPETEIPVASDYEDKDESELSKSTKSISFADDLNSSMGTSRSGKTLVFNDDESDGFSRSSFGQRDSGYSRYSDGSLASQNSTQTTGSGTHSIHSVSQFTDANGVSVDLAGRGLAGMNVGTTETVTASGQSIKPERPSNLLAVHSSKYSAQRQLSDASTSSYKSKKSVASTGRQQSGSRAVSGPISRPTMSPRRDSSSSSLGSSRSSSRNMSTNSRRSGRGHFWDDDVRDSGYSRRSSELSARSAGMSFSKRAASIMKKQNSFRDSREVKSEFFGEGATVHLTQKETKIEQVDPDDVQLDFYQNDLEFADVYQEEESFFEANHKLFYNFETINEQRRLLMVKWLVEFYTEEELKNLSEELGEMLDQAPKTNSTLNGFDADQAKDVAFFIEETDRAVREKKHKELEEIYEQRLRSVVEALVMKAHQRAELDMATTAIRDGKGVDLMNINKEEMQMRFYDTYETTIEIGCGHLSQVLLCNVKNKPSDLFAVKVVNKTELSKQRLRYLKNELNLAQSLTHPCLVKTYDIFDHWDYSFIVMEYVSGGTLLDFLKRETLIEEEDAKKFMFDILRAVAFMHKHHIIHRDLKFDNILCTQSDIPLQIKIADFGLARLVNEKKEKKVKRVPRTDNKEAYMVVKENELREKGLDGTISENDRAESENGTINTAYDDLTSAPSGNVTPALTEETGDLEFDEEDDENILTSAVGTPAYAAPELLRGEPYSYGVDVWACGVILYGMLGGSRPFTGRTPDGVLQSIERGGVTFPKREWSGVSEQARSLIRAMLEVNPEYRVTADEAMRHTWFTAMTTM